MNIQVFLPVSHVRRRLSKIPSEAPLLQAQTSAPAHSLISKHRDTRGKCHCTCQSTSKKLNLAMACKICHQMSKHCHALLGGLGTVGGQMFDDILAVRQIICQIHQNSNTSSNNCRCIWSEIGCGILSVYVTASCSESSHSSPAKSRVASHASGEFEESTFHLGAERATS